MIDRVPGRWNKPDRVVKSKVAFDDLGALGFDDREYRADDPGHAFRIVLITRIGGSVSRTRLPRRISISWAGSPSLKITSPALKSRAGAPAPAKSLKSTGTPHFGRGAPT